jgi:hypothetical protein
VFVKNEKQDVGRKPTDAGQFEKEHQADDKGSLLATRGKAPSCGATEVSVLIPEVSWR